MTQTIKALSLTSNVKDWMANSRQPKVLHVFDEVCNLMNERREVLSLVTADIGNGPFSLVVENSVLFTKHLDVHSKVSIEDNQLKIGDLVISFARAQMWNPKPNWEGLRNKKNQVFEQLAPLQVEHDNDAILQFSNLLALSVIKVDIPSVKNTATKLAGLGIGLTPAGDDFLMGAVYAAWIIHPHEVAKNITEEIANVAAPLTTTLSGAWLKSAAKGEAGELWHDFFVALIEDKNLYLPMSKILSVGETSGSDALTGFLSTIQAYIAFLSLNEARSSFE